MGRVNTDNAVGALINSAFWKIKNHFANAINEHNLKVTPEQWNLMNIIADNPGITQTELSQKGNKDKTNVTRILDVLDKNGFITRSTDRKDRRVFRINLTDAGTDIIEKVIPIAAKVKKNCYSGFSEKELEQFNDYLMRICKNTNC